MWGLNIYFLIGLLIVLAFAGVMFIALWTGLKMWLWRTRQRRSWQAYQRQSRRADGRPYPPASPGVCDQCGRTSKTIYLAPSAHGLCPPCYESYWRQAEQGGIAHSPNRLRDELPLDGKDHNAFIIIDTGKDGLYGTDDDITNFGAGR